MHCITPHHIAPTDDVPLELLLDGEFTAAMHRLTCDGSGGNPLGGGNTYGAHTYTHALAGPASTPAGAIMAFPPAAAAAGGAAGITQQPSMALRQLEYEYTRAAYTTATAGAAAAAAQPQQPLLHWMAHNQQHLNHNQHYNQQHNLQYLQHPQAHHMPQRQLMLQGSSGSAAARGAGAHCFGRHSVSGGSASSSIGDLYSRPLGGGLIGNGADVSQSVPLPGSLDWWDQQQAPPQQDACGGRFYRPTL